MHRWCVSALNERWFFFSPKSQSKLKLLHADCFWLIGSLWTVTPLPIQIFLQYFWKSFSYRIKYSVGVYYLSCSIACYCLLFLTFAPPHHLGRRKHLVLWRAEQAMGGQEDGKHINFGPPLSPVFVHSPCIFGINSKALGSEPSQGICLCRV